MVNAASIKRTLQSSIFNALGSSVQIHKRNDSSTLTNIYGEDEVVYDSPSTVTGVPYSQLSSRSWETQGDSENADLEIVFPHDTDVDFDDKITFDGVDYKIVDIEKYPLQDTNLAILVRVAKIHS